MVRLNDPTYAAGQSKCEPYREDPSAQPPEAKSYAQAPPAQTLFLADLASGKLVERVFDGGLGGKFPHYVGIGDRGWREQASAGVSAHDAVTTSSTPEMC